MKKLLFLFLLLFETTIICAQDAQTAWKELYPAIEKRIVAPKFPNKSYDIRDFGAVKGDSSRLNHEIINRVIQTCSQQGGGRVVIPAGIWYTGPLVLRSGVNLYLAEGAVLRFSTNPYLYPPVLTRWEGMDCYNLHPLVYAYGEKNIAITGTGTLDGAASNANWYLMHGKPERGWKEGMFSQLTGRPKLMQWNDDEVPVEQRQLTVSDGLRPQLVNFFRCENILIEGITLTRSPFWTIHPLLCRNLTVRNIHVDTPDAPNGDGCDPESCSDVLIEGCHFNTGDDCIAIKSGRNNDGRRWNIPSKNIIVRNCFMANGHGGVVVGSEISGGYQNLFVENCQMDSPLLDRVIRIKTNARRGGIIENVYVRNVEVGQCKEAVLKLNLNYDRKEVGPRDFPPVIRNVWMENVHCSSSRYGIFVDGYKEIANVRDIHVSGCRWDGVKEGNRFQGLTENVEIKETFINGEKVD